MALPTIVFNNSTGSDSAASGAGPSTALTGADASTDTAGTVVTLPNADLTNVVTDGSHALWLNTSSGRQFSGITAKADSGQATANVTVANAYTGDLTGQTYAIGGKRKDLHETNSLKIWQNGGSTGDAISGWTVNVEETGTNYTLGARIIPHGIGAINNPVVLKSSSATRPIIEANGATIGASPIIDVGNNTSPSAHVALEHLHLRRLGTASFSPLVRVGGTTGIKTCLIRDCVMDAANGAVTNSLVNGLDFNNNSTGSSVVMIDSYIHSIGGSVIRRTSGASDRHTIRVSGCHIHDAGGGSVPAFDVERAVISIDDTIIEGGGSHGIHLQADNPSSILIKNCTIDGCSGDGIRIEDSSSVTGSIISNNILSNNSGFGLNCVQSSTDRTSFVDFNNYFNNTSGARNNIAAGPNDLALDPQFTDAANGNFEIGTNLKAKGFPLSTRTIGANARATNSFVDIGAAQREEPAGAGGSANIFRSVVG